MLYWINIRHVESAIPFIPVAININAQVAPCNQLMVSELVVKKCWVVVHSLCSLPFRYPTLSRNRERLSLMGNQVCPISNIDTGYEYGNGNTFLLQAWTWTKRKHFFVASLAKISTIRLFSWDLIGIIHLCLSIFN